MNAPTPDNPLWREHLERLRRLNGQGPSRARRTATRPIVMNDWEEARREEWTATPPGRLGRRLLADIEPYLAFFTIARAD
jgi:hypothetical protein